jgi:hypothetical protein
MAHLLQERARRLGRRAIEGPFEGMSNPYETTIVPGEKRELRERFPRETLFIGIVADYYRASGDASGVRSMTTRGGCGWFSTRRIVLGPRDLPKE